MPYITYNVITLMSANNGTYEEYENGMRRKSFTQTISFTAIAETDIESVHYAIKAHDWLDNVGTHYLNDNDVIVETIGNITNRDNVLTIGYLYMNGFDIFLRLYNVIEDEGECEYIKDINISGKINR